MTSGSNGPTSVLWEPVTQGLERLLVTVVVARVDALAAVDDAEGTVERRVEIVRHRRPACAAGVDSCGGDREVVYAVRQRSADDARPAERQHPSPPISRRISR